MDETQSAEAGPPQPREPAPDPITVFKAWCKKCGICIAFCPTAVFTSDDFGLAMVSKPEKCIKCMLCVIRCPDFCIEVEPLKE